MHSTYTGVLILEFMQALQAKLPVIGTAGRGQVSGHIKMLTDGMRVGDLVVLAADTSFNTTNINLVGLAQTGIEYLPVV